MSHLHIPLLTLEVVQPRVDGVEVVVVLPVHVAALVARPQPRPLGDLLRVGVLHAVLNLPVLTCYTVAKSSKTGDLNTVSFFYSMTCIEIYCNQSAAYCLTVTDVTV